MRFRLLCCLAKALAKNGVKFLCGLVPGGDVLYDIASDAWEDYRQGSPRDGLRAELGALALAAPAEVQLEAQEAAAAAHLPVVAQQQLAAYLGQVPGMIRRSLRRPSDPTGTTVPATLPLRSPEDLLPFLPPSPPRFRPGMRPLPGVDWVLEEPLGVGGFGEVWKARHAHLKSKPPVALKFCLDPSAAAVLRNEAGVLDRLMQHGRQQGVVPLLDAYLNADPPCLVYEYVGGGDLSGLIWEMHAGRRAKPDAATRLLLQLAEILASVHRAEPPIVHDDLKPSNVLVRRGAGRELEMHVTDFGIGGLAVDRAVRQTRQPTHTREQLLTEAVRGAHTPLYASPEQMVRRRGEQADPRDDVHALGVIWYQLLTGDLRMTRLPSDWREEVRKGGLSEKLTELLASCLASRAEKRPADAGVLVERLRAELHPAPRRSSVAVGVWLALCFLLTVAVILGALWANRATFAVPDNPVRVGRAAEAAPPSPDENRKPNVAPEPPKTRPVANPVVAEPRKGQDFTNSIGMKLKWIEPGSFWMGSPDGSTPGLPAEFVRFKDETRHHVTLTKGFHMGVYPVTRGQFAAFVKDDGYQTAAEKAGEKCTWRDPGFDHYTQTDDDPVVYVTWDDAVRFCQWLSTKDGRTYELPTEAEWEYACRAGTTTAYSFGDDPQNFGDNAWYKDNAAGQTHPVGGKTVNPWGLYDMQGAVWQWCLDAYGPYSGADITDPFNHESADRIMRGGSWFNIVEVCRAACRSGYAPGTRSNHMGFRVRCRPD